MLTDIIIQMFDCDPRRPLSVFGVLRGRKTASVLYAGLEYGIQQWRGLIPRLDRSALLKIVEQMVANGLATEQAAGLVLTPAGQTAKKAAAEKCPLPSAYRQEYQARIFSDRLFLAVQVISEALANNHKYVPVSADWQVQGAVRTWYRAFSTRLPAVVAELTAAFELLPTDAADTLAGSFVGHDYSGRVQDNDWLVNLGNISMLIEIIANDPAEYPALTMLWGGPGQLVSDKAIYCVEQLIAGRAIDQIAKQLHRKISTVNEYLQESAILATPLNPRTLLEKDMEQALATAWKSGTRNYQELLLVDTRLTFMQVRLFQIWQLREEARQRG